MSSLRRYRRTGAALALVGLLIALPWLYRYGVQNLAQLSRLAGRPDPRLFEYALTLAPNDEHLRWQAGVALAEVGQSAEAATILQPLMNDTSRYPQLTEVLLASIFDSGQNSQALNFYQQLATRPELDSGTATRVVAGYLHQAGKVPPDQTFWLLSEVFGWLNTTPAAQTYEAQLRAPGFWGSSFGQRINAAMQWREQPQPIPPAPVVWAITPRERAAVVLQVPPDSLRLGDELLTNGGFEMQNLLTNYPLGWKPALLTSGSPWNLGAFIVGADHSHASEGTAALRIEGIFAEQQPDRETSTAGLIHPPVTIQPGKPYLLSFAYCTADLVGGTPSIFLNNDPQVLLSEHSLPGTDGYWRWVTVIAWNRSGREAAVTPLLRLRNEGNVWFDQLSLRPLIAPQVEARDTPVIVVDEASTGAPDCG